MSGPVTARAPGRITRWLSFREERASLSVWMAGIRYRGEFIQ